MIPLVDGGRESSDDEEDTAQGLVSMEDTSLEKEYSEEETDEEVCMYMCMFV